MSYTGIKAIWPGDRAETIRKLSNAWGFGPVVWRQMCACYLGNKNLWFDTSRHTDLWALSANPYVISCARVVLMMTYDYVYVEKKDYQRAAAHIREYLKFFEDYFKNTEGSNHWWAIAEFFESKPDYPAIGFRASSVGEDLFAGPYNQDIDDHDPLDWSRTWSLYERFDKFEEMFRDMVTR
jgi:hypothetical protein